MTDLSLKSVRKSFGPVETIRGVDLDIKSGEFVVFVGPSGCGKSTLLRMIAGLETVTSGNVVIGGTDVTTTRPAKRGIAMVFQSYALFPHLNVADNISFGLQLANTPKQEVDRRVQDVASVLQIESLLDRRPKQLSGGQRQRVAIGRAIIRDPKVFLFDEPLSNLDAALRVQMRLELARLHARLDATMIYVTHDQVEAMTLADRIVVLNGGRIEQVGTPMELYNTPANLFVARFIGSPAMNLISGQCDGNHLSIGDRRWVVPAGIPKGKVTIGVRPENLRVTEDPSEQLLSAPIAAIERLGDESICYLTRGSLEDPIAVKADPDFDFGVEQAASVTFGGGPVHLFDEGGARVTELFPENGMLTTR